MRMMMVSTNMLTFRLLVILFGFVVLLFLLLVDVTGVSAHDDANNDNNNVLVNDNNNVDNVVSSTRNLVTEGNNDLGLSCDELLVMIDEMDPIFNTTLDDTTCDCDTTESGIMATCQLQNGCILTKLNPMETGVNGNYLKGDYTIVATSSMPITEFDDILVNMRTCFTYPEEATNSGVFAGKTACITTLTTISSTTGGDGTTINADGNVVDAEDNNNSTNTTTNTTTIPTSTVECLGITVDEESCDVCDVCTVLVDEDGDDGIIDGEGGTGDNNPIISYTFDCTELGYGSNIKDSTTICSQENTQNTIIQFAHEHVLIPKEDENEIVECGGNFIGANDGNGGGNSGAALDLVVVGWYGSVVVAIAVVVLSSSTTMMLWL